MCRVLRSGGKSLTTWKWQYVSLTKYHLVTPDTYSSQPQLHNTSSALYRVSQFSKLTNDYAEKLEEDMGRVYEEMKESQPKISPMEVLKALARAS